MMINFTIDDSIVMEPEINHIMKNANLLLLSLLMLLSTVLCGQNAYEPVNFDYGRWVFVSHQKGPYWGTEYEYDTVRYYFEGDTVISNQPYRKLFFTGISYHSAPQGLEYKLVDGYSGAMRNDTLNRKVWFNGSIAYDYNLSVNDTIKAGIYQGQVIGAIDSVQHCDQYFRRFSFLNSSDPPALIENIRALDVVIIPYQGPTGYCDLACYYETNNVNCTSCITILGLDNMTLQSLNIYPNPTEGKVHISGSSGMAEISLFDIYGEKLISKSIDKTTCDFDLTGYSNGIYMLRIVAKNGTLSKKILKR